MAQTADVPSQALLRQHHEALAKSDAINNLMQDYQEEVEDKDQTIKTLALLLIASIGANIFLLQQLTH